VAGVTILENLMVGVGKAIPMLTWWSWINDNGSGLGAIAAVAAAVIAILAIIRTAADNRERSQPMMTAEFRVSPDSDTTVELMIRNAGQTPARNIEVAFEPPLSIPGGRGGPYMTEYTIERYSKRIPVLSPGQELTNIWWSGEAGRANELENREPTPDEVHLKIAYDGLGKKRIQEDYLLTVDTVKLTTRAVSTDSFKGRLKSIDQALSRTAKAVEGLAKKGG
jgi:hypothetical protein